MQSSYSSLEMHESEEGVDGILTWCRKPRSSSRAPPKPPVVSDSSKRKKTLEEEFWDNYKPPIPDLSKNRYVLVAGLLLATGILS
jgi:hypothetical protein